MMNTAIEKIVTTEIEEKKNVSIAKSNDGLTVIELKKHSALIAVKTTELTLPQRKLYNVILYLAGKALQKESTTQLFKFKFSDILELAGYSEVSNYKFLKDGLEKMLDIKVEYNILDKPTKQEKGWGGFHLFSQVIIDKFDEYITIAYPPIIYENLQYPDVYALLNITILNSLHSAYSVILYELLTDYKKINKYRIDIGTLRNLLGVKETEYKEFKDFKKRCLVPAVNEINEKTDLFIEYEFDKTGKKYTAILFHIKYEINDLTPLESSTYYLLRSKGLNEKTANKFAKQLSKESILGALEILEKAIKAGNIKNISAYLTTLLKNAKTPIPVINSYIVASVENDIKNTDFQKFYEKRTEEIIQSITDSDIELFLGSQAQFTINYLIEKNILDHNRVVVDRKAFLKNSIFVGYIQQKYLDYDIEKTNYLQR